MPTASQRKEKEWGWGSERGSGLQCRKEPVWKKGHPVWLFYIVIGNKAKNGEEKYQRTESRGWKTYRSQKGPTEACRASQVLEKA